MDPNEVLLKTRAACATLMANRADLIRRCKGAYGENEVDELLDGFAALDVWLSKGGDVPKAWSVRTVDVRRENQRSRGAGGVGGYPPNWPKCPGCGRPALDGKVTCGDVQCGAPSGYDRPERWGQ